MTAPAEQTVKRKKVFVSHASEDKPVIEQLVDDLEKLDLDVWFDAKSITVGDSIPAEINEGLKGADYVIIALSQHSVQLASLAFGDLIDLMTDGLNLNEVRMIWGKLVGNRIRTITLIFRYRIADLNSH